MKKQHFVLILIFIITLVTRLYFASQSPYFDYDAYAQVQIIEHITETGLPLYNDALSISNETLIYPPLFYYILAFFNLFMPLALVGKIIPNIFASCLVIVSYLIAVKISKNTNTALFTSFITGFIPLFISWTINSLSSYTLAIPMMFYMLYCVMNLDDKKYVYHFLILVFLLPLIHSISFLFILGLLFYLLLVRIEHLNIKRSELEIVLFSTFLIIWIGFIILKQAFLSLGPFIIWQNIPTQILGTYFRDINLLEALYQISFIPFIFGLLMIYNSVFKEKDKNLMLLTSFAISTFIILMLKLIQPEIGFIILGITLSLLASQFFKIFFIYFEKTKFSDYKAYLFLLLLLIFIITSVVPSLSYAAKEMRSTPQHQEVEAMVWIKDNIPEDQPVLTTLKEAHMLNAIGKKPNLLDSNFLFADKPSVILDDINQIYTTIYKTDAIKILNKYDIKYIYLSPYTKDRYRIKELSYSDDQKCFELLYNSSVQIYKSKCGLTEI